MQKICAIILISALATNYEALPQTKWSRLTRHSQGQLTRERRQFPFGEWIPLSQPCPTCRPFADPLDVGLRGDNIGLTPPRPPAVTRQIHGDGNFFTPDESSILSVPPPPPSTIPSSNENFQFSGFGQQFNSPLAIPGQKVFPQTQQIKFLPQTFLPNQPLLVKGNQQILSGLNAQNNLFGQDQSQQQINNGKVASFNPEFKTQKLPENVVLEHNKKPAAPPKQAFSNKPQPFTQSQQSFTQQQSFNGQQQHSVNFGNSILTPPPVPNNASQDIVIPGLDKEEIQLLYVPVETLRQRGTAQEQLLTQQPQNIQFHNRVNGLQRPVNNIRPTEQTLVTSAKGHFVTQNGNGQADNPVKVTSTQPFPTSVTPATLYLQHLPFHQTPQPFVSATPVTPTIQPFVTPASVFQKFSPFTPETTLSHLSTVPNTIQFSQSDVEFGTTPKTISNQGDLKEEIINGKPQFSGLKSAGFSQEQERPLQHLQQTLVNQQQAVTKQPQLNTIFPQEQLKEFLTQNQFPHQINQQQIALQKQQEHQRLLQQQRQKELEEQRSLEQQRKQKELEEQRLLQQQQRQKELEQQRLLQKQKELEEQRLLQQRRQKELEQQRFLQKQKELEEQRLLQQRQKELEEQFLQEQRQKELEEQRRLQLQKQRELEEKRRLQLKQKEEEQRLLRFQQQQKELEQQRLIQQQQEEQQRLLQQQKLQEQKQENLKKQQQFQFYQQQQLQHQQKHSLPQQVFQQANRHILPSNDKLNFIPQLEKESEPEDQQLVPHQPPLSVFFKGFSGAEARITDVLRELRSSNTITVLDQYFEQMPKVFVGPAGLIPPPGYGKFELPYLSNLENNRIERRIDKLPFFVAPLNFVPPPGYAKIPFPAPHVGSVVVSSESNPAMTLKSAEKASAHEEGSFPVVGPELPGLINNLDTETTTVKPTNYVSTPSLPQTTAQLRNRRPSSSLYKPQSRKPVTRTRPTTTSKPEEVTQPIQKVEISEGGIRKPFNRFLNRRRQQAKTTTDNPLKDQQDGKSLENRHYSVEVYHEEKNQFSRTQPKSDEIKEKKNEENEYNRRFEQPTASIDRITPNGHGVFEVHPTPDFSKTSQTETFELNERRPDVSDYADINLQPFEDGPLPTGSAKTITQELYRPNIINQAEEDESSKPLPKPVSTPSPVNYQSGIYEDGSTTSFTKVSNISPTTGLLNYKENFSEKETNIQTTPVVRFEKQGDSTEGYPTTEISRTKVTLAASPATASEEQHTKGFSNSNEQHKTAFAEISKPHHIPGFIDSSAGEQSKFSEAYPTPEISADLQVPFSQKYSQESDVSDEFKPTHNSAESSPTGLSNEQYLSGFEGVAKNRQPLETPTSQVNPTAPGATDDRYTTRFSVNSQPQNSAGTYRGTEDDLSDGFINFHDIQSTPGSLLRPQQYFPSSTEFPFPSPITATDNVRISEPAIIVEENQGQISSTPETSVKDAVNPSVQTYSSESGSEDSVQLNGQTLTSEDQGQVVSDNFSNNHRLKFSNPSIVRVRTRVKGKSRGQVNFAASQSTTPVPFTRSAVENREQEYTTRTNHFRDFNPVKTSKYNQLRGVKKPLRTTTTEATTEYEQKANVYTIRPQRRPLSPSTVSTKRIRRPTTPLPSAEIATEAFGVSTIGSYSHSENSDISPSGVSNDVYYEQSSLSPVKHKLRKHFVSAEQKNDFVPEYVSTTYLSPSPTYSSFPQEYSKEPYAGRDLPQTRTPSLENLEKYPEWNPIESGFDVSGIVLTTTTRAPGYEDQPESEEPKKPQDSKKAFDPDLEKKTGRRRVRVRVHKRPHENFETAESQNLRTVANVLVPPTSTYKPNDESGFHQLAKNADFSFGGQKLFGLRSREYFKKRLNVTISEGVSQNPNNGEQSIEEKIQGVNEATEKANFVRKPVEKLQKNDSDANYSQSNESSESNRFVRPKFRGFVRKIIKHGGVSKDADSESNQVPENEENEGKHESIEPHPRQPFKVNQGGFNFTGRFNGTRHKTFVRYVKKNKIRHHETESHQESNLQQSQKEEQGFHQTTESHTLVPDIQKEIQKETQVAEIQPEKEEKTIETHFPVNHSSEEVKKLELQQPETTEETEFKQSQQPLTQTSPQAVVESDETPESSSPKFYETVSNTPEPVTPPPTQQTGLYFSSKPKFYQTLRPLFQRTTQTGFQRTRESESHSSTTEQSVQEPQEKRNGFTRLKYGKTAAFGATSTDKSEEIKKPNDLQLKNKNLHTLEVRKYLRTKSREGAFSQFSKNKYLTSEKTETTATTKQQESVEKESVTEKSTESSSNEFQPNSNESKTTQVFESQTDLTEIEGDSTENYEESEMHVSTTETFSSKEEESSEEDATNFGNTETTTENEAFQTSDSETHENVTEPKLVMQTTEKVEVQQTEYQPDIYRFSKNSFSFDEAEKFTGTKNRAHVRNITTDIIENTASFSAPGVEKRTDIRIVTHRADDQFPAVTESRSEIVHKEKTEETAITESSSPETTTTDYTEITDVETTASTEGVTKTKIAKILKTSTTTKISHETEICYRGKCIRTKSENPDEDLKLLVDSASTMKIEKTKT